MKYTSEIDLEAAAKVLRPTVKPRSLSVIGTKEDQEATSVVAPRWARAFAMILSQSWSTALALVVMDLIGVLVGFLLGFAFGQYVIRMDQRIYNYFPSLLCFGLFTVIFLCLKDGYTKPRGRRPEDELRNIVLGVTWAIALALIAHFVLLKEVILSRYILITGYILALSLIINFRFTFRQLTKRLWSYGLARENVIIVGDSVKEVSWLIKHLRIQRYHGFNFLGYLARKPSFNLSNNFKYLGDFSRMGEIAGERSVDKVFFAMGGYSDQRHQSILQRIEECARLNISVLIISEIFNHFNFFLTLDGYSGIFAIDRREPAYSAPLYCLVKRSIDILASLLILVSSLPLWVVATVAIKLQDGGPIFFRHRLVGKNGKLFDLLKFRTMVTNAQEILEKDPALYKKFCENFKLADDPRVTRFGKWLRKYSLDELPQLINILKGDMSLVGPRPVKEKELGLFGNFKSERIKVRPGLTGFWQVSGRCSTNYEERIQMDKFYMFKCNTWMDLFILLKTPMKVLSGEGAS